MRQVKVHVYIDNVEVSCWLLKGEALHGCIVLSDVDLASRSLATGHAFNHLIRRQSLLHHHSWLGDLQTRTLFGLNYPPCLLLLSLGVPYTLIIRLHEGFRLIFGLKWSRKVTHLATPRRHKAADVCITANRPLGEF